MLNYCSDKIGDFGIVYGFGAYDSEGHETRYFTNIFSNIGVKDCLSWLRHASKHYSWVVSLQSVSKLRHVINIVIITKETAVLQYYSYLLV